jgi:hypothetical protein
MKFTLSFVCLLFCFSVYAQDSTRQKHGLFKLSGVSVIGGASFFNYNNANSENISKQSLLNVWSSFANKSFYNYSQNIVNSKSNNNGNMFGAYLSFDNYSKKKMRYAIHSQTNVGISVYTQSSLSASFYTNKTSAKDTFSINSTPFYTDTNNKGNAFVGYQSKHVGIDIQQIYTTKQSDRFSFFAGIGVSATISTISQIIYTQSEQGIIYNSNPNAYPGQNNYYLTTSNNGIDKIKSSVLYQIYIPFGFNIRFGNDDKSTLSHFYISPQIRVGYEILKLQAANAFVFNTSYATIGMKYMF